ncbi:MAG: SAM-dependent methyltransferase [Myxococcales bacterium]|nr:SAM-dependent methyltransferase [Myxococcales bacterium]
MTERKQSRRSGVGRARPLREDLVLEACLEAYGAIRHEGRLADRALDFTLRHKRHLYSAERRAVAERVYELLRRQVLVDYLLERGRPRFDALPTSQKDLLRVAAARALAGERAEEVSRSMRLSGGDEGVLRRLPEIRRQLEALEPKQRLSIEASLPPFLAERFLAELGEEASRAAEAMNRRAPLCARVNTLALSREELMKRLRGEGVECRPTELSPLGVVLETRLNAFSLRAFREGAFELQDEGSQLLGVLVDPPPTKVVDACAGAGGKSLQLAAAMRNRGELFALDVESGRMDELRKRARRAGVHNVRVRVIPEAGTVALAALEDLKGKADRVLVDAPCSGSGTLRRKPDARYRLTPEDLSMHVARQEELLERFLPLLSPRGRLVYGTCSVLREENEAVVERFLSRHPELRLIPVEEVLGASLGPKVSRGGYLRLYPHLHGTDGFFGAILAASRLAPAR